MVYIQKLPTIKYSSSQYSLEINLKKASLSITMQLLSTPLSTKRLVATNDILNQELPSIFQSQCFNDDNLSFFEEAKNTEIGHLFEHILLENLAQTSALDENSSVSGRTSWNWEQDPIGRFHIQINPIHYQRSEVFQSLSYSIALTNQILSSQQTLIS